MVGIQNGTNGGSAATRAVALVGPAGTGKTSLAEALLFASGAINRQGSVEAGSSVGDASPEARARGSSTEVNLYHLNYMGDRFALIDVPGGPGFAADGLAALQSADMALVVIDPAPERAALAEPMLRQLDALGVPHAIFVNKIEHARAGHQGLPVEHRHRLAAAAGVEQHVVEPVVVMNDGERRGLHREPGQDLRRELVEDRRHAGLQQRRETGLDHFDTGRQLRAVHADHGLAAHPRLGQRGLVSPQRGMHRGRGIDRCHQSLPCIWWKVGKF